MKEFLVPPRIATAAADKMIAEGLKKRHFKVWRTESRRMQIVKAIGHALTHCLIRPGHKPPDVETRLKNAITRLAMTPVQELKADSSEGSGQ